MRKSAKLMRFGLQTISFSPLNISFTTYNTGICCIISPRSIFPQMYRVRIAYIISSSEKISAQRIQCLSFFSLHPDPYRPMSLCGRFLTTCFPYLARWLKSTSSLMRLPIYINIFHIDIVKQIFVFEHSDCLNCLFC